MTSRARAVREIKPALLLRAIGATPARPSVVAFPDKQRDDRKRTDAVDPPKSKQCLRRKAYDSNERQPPAGDRFDGVSPQRPAAEPFGKVQLGRAR